MKTLQKYSLLGIHEQEISLPKGFQIVQVNSDTLWVLVDTGNAPEVVKVKR